MASEPNELKQCNVLFQFKFSKKRHAHMAFFPHELINMFSITNYSDFHSVKYWDTTIIFVILLNFDDNPDPSVDVIQNMVSCQIVKCDKRKTRKVWRKMCHFLATFANPPRACWFSE